MKRYWGILGLVLLLLLAIFFVAEGFGIETLTDPTTLMRTRTVGAAMAGVGLLTADAILPIPASLVMLMNGVLFGVWVGAALSVVGSLGASVAAFAIGRQGASLLDRLLSPEDRWKAEQRIARWGFLAIVITRPIPLLAETTILAAGASQMGWRPMLLATLAGSIPPALLYAALGTMVEVPSDNSWVWFAAVALCCVAGAISFLRRRNWRQEATQL